MTERWEIGNINIFVLNFLSFSHTKVSKNISSHFFFSLNSLSFRLIFIHFILTMFVCFGFSYFFVFFLMFFSAAFLCRSILILIYSYYFMVNCSSRFVSLYFVLFYFFLYFFTFFCSTIKSPSSFLSLFYFINHIFCIINYFSLLFRWWKK